MRVMFLIGCLMLQAGSAVAQDSPSFEGNLFDQITSLRLETERLAASQNEISQERDLLNQELNSLAAKIKKHKKEHPNQGLLPDLELQRLLQQSQELSDKLTTAQRQIDALGHVRKDRMEMLSRSYDRVIEQVAGLVHQTAASDQQKTLLMLSRLRKERELLRQKLNPARSVVGSLKSPETLLLSDDPEELSERADVVRDEQERLRRQLNRLDKRSAELQAESRLDQQLRDFVNDQNLFGEESRTLPFSQTGIETSKSAADPGKNNEGGTPTDTNHDGDSAFGGSMMGGAGEPGGVRVQDGQTPLSVDQSDLPMSSMDPTTELRQLSRQRLLTIERIKKLQLLHDRLLEKAESLPK